MPEESQIEKKPPELPEKKVDYFKLSHEYYQEAIALNKEGKEFRQILSKSNKMRLLGMKQMGIRRVEISTADNSCSSCRRQKKKYLIEEAIEKMPLPNPKCTLKVFTEDGDGFCRCTYAPADS